MLITLFQGRTHTSVDFLIFGSMTLVAGVISMRLPETLNAPMPETFDDLTVGSGKDSRTITLDVMSDAITEDKLKLLEGELNALDNEAGDDSVVT